MVSYRRPYALSIIYTCVYTHTNTLSFLAIRVRTHARARAIRKTLSYLKFLPRHKHIEMFILHTVFAFYTVKIRVYTYGCVAKPTTLSCEVGLGIRF